MRNLLTILSLVLSSSSLFGQGQPDIVVRNATSCPVYYRLFLSVIATPCAASSSSGVLMLAPGSSATFSSSSFPGTYHFINVRVYGGMPSCTSNSILVGDPICLYANTGNINLLNNPPACTSCTNATVDWVLGGVGSLQTVVIH